MSRAWLNELKSAGVDALYCRADVASREDHASMLDQIRERFGRLDVLR